MINLFGEMQICPALAHLPLIAYATASSMLASSSTTKGSFPPNYITALFKYLPAFSAIVAPVTDDPVKLTP